MFHDRTPTTWRRGLLSLGAIALSTLAFGSFGCAKQGNTGGPTVGTSNVAPAMAAFDAVSGEMDAASDTVNSGSDSAATVGALTSSNSIELNIAQDATLNAQVDLDRVDGLGHDRFPYHTGKVNITASGDVTGNYSENGTGSLNGSVNYAIDHSVVQDVVYTRGGYSATLGAGATAQHTLNAVWSQSGATHTHSVTAHKQVNNLAVAVSGPDGAASATISCDVNAKSVYVNATENENSVSGWWKAVFPDGWVKVSILAVDKPGTANDIFVVSVVVNGVLTSTNFNEGAFDANHPGCHIDILRHFWVATYIRIDNIFSDGERGWHCWDRVIEGVSKAIDADARAHATVSGNPLDYQATTSGSVTFPTAEVPDLSGTISYTANGSVTTDYATYANVSYGVTITASTDLVYTPATGYSATIAAGANHAWNLAINVTRTDDQNYTVHLDVDATQTIPSLVVTTPVDTLTLSSSVAVSGTYDEVAASGVVTKSASLHAEWTATATNTDGTVTAHRKLDLTITG
ncbi:MAG TPA: hypothetical protein VL860_13795 [Planctomycetota bacterium]|nr:hypothetical protein [Planctomycetota bacterium]